MDVNVLREVLMKSRVGILKYMEMKDEYELLGINVSGDQTYDIDKVAESVIINEFQKHGFRGTILSEESGSIKLGDGDEIAVIDPLDGSKNAIKSLPFYSISIAIAKGPKLSNIYVSGVIDLVNGDIIIGDENYVMYNDSIAKPSNISELSNAYVSIMFKMFGYDSADKYVPKLIKLIKNVGYPRFFGSAALETSYVAIGKIDAFIDVAPRLRIVDVAAGIHLVKSAGGYVRCLGQDLNNIPLASNVRIAYVAASNEVLGKELIKLIS